MFLNKRTMEMVYWILDPIIDFLAALRITPNMVTLFSLVPAAGAGVALGFGWFGLASVLAVMATFCDILDGLLARKTGVSSAAGEVIDAAVDRYGEMFFFGGLVYYYRTHDQVLFIVLAAIVGSFMVSYATAKAEAMGVAAPRGAMRRGERAALPDLRRGVHAASRRCCSRTRRRWRCNELPIILALSIVAVVSNISVVQRFGGDRRAAAREGEGAAGRARGGRRRAAGQQAGRVGRPGLSLFAAVAAGSIAAPGRAVAVLGVDPPPHDRGDLDDRRLQRDGRDRRARGTSVPSPRRRSRRSRARSPTSR